jgi:hypothetical protein
MRECSVIKRIRIVQGGREDYKRLAEYHYRDSTIGPYAAIFAMRMGTKTIGVIVYTMPTMGLELRNVATGGFFGGFDKKTGLSLINRNIRRISRVIIEPRFRGLGLASRLVRETMPKINVPIIEAMAVMGTVNPFFEKAGMTAYTAKMPARCVQLIEAFGMVGVEEKELVDPQKVQQRIEQLGKRGTEFVEQQVKGFLQSYGKRRNMPTGAERTRFVLSKLTERPVYYLWINRNLEIGT